MSGEHRSRPAVSAKDPPGVESSVEADRARRQTDGVISPAAADSVPVADHEPRESHANQFGIVRLVLAGLVLLSHSFPLAQGFGHAEPLETLTRTTTFGDLAVDFFFVISGYLVSQSLDRSRSIRSYLTKRVRRIYPGFAVAIAVSIVLALACSGRWQNPDDLLNLALSYFILRQPVIAAAFGGNPYTTVNGSLWTIQYEFCCYLIPVAFLVMRLHRRTLLVFAVAISLILLSDFSPRDGGGALAPLHNGMRLAGMFAAGMGFRLLGEEWWGRPRLAFAAGVLCVLLLFGTFSAGIGLALPGGYALLALCRHPGRGLISRIGRRTDISYGVYLYAWPIQSVVVWIRPAIDPWLLFVLAMPLTLGAGWLSWSFVESRFLLKQRLRPTA